MNGIIKFVVELTGAGKAAGDANKISTAMGTLRQSAEKVGAAVPQLGAALRLLADPVTGAIMGSALAFRSAKGWIDDWVASLKTLASPMNDVDGRMKRLAENFGKARMDARAFAAEMAKAGQGANDPASRLSGEEAAIDAAAAAAKAGAGPRAAKAIDAAAEKEKARARERTAAAARAELEQTQADARTLARMESQAAQEVADEQARISGLASNLEANKAINAQKEAEAAAQHAEWYGGLNQFLVKAGGDYVPGLGSYLGAKRSRLLDTDTAREGAANMVRQGQLELIDRRAALDAKKVHLQDVTSAMSAAQAQALNAQKFLTSNGATPTKADEDFIKELRAIRVATETTAKKDSNLTRR